MNEKQRKLLLVSTAVAVLMGLVPPWTNVVDQQDLHLDRPGGYGLVFHPPAPEIKGNVPVSVRIDVARLLVQWAILALAGVGGYFYFRDSDGKRGPEM